MSHNDFSPTRCAAGRSLPVRIIRFYVDGFRQMTVGRWLWLIILVKLFIMFFVFKLFFFPDVLSRDYDSDADRANAVRKALIDRSINNNLNSIICNHKTK